VGTCTCLSVRALDTCEWRIYLSLVPLLASSELNMITAAMLLSDSSSCVNLYCAGDVGEVSNLLANGLFDDCVHEKSELVVCNIGCE
jgi:hypothetical protein